MINRARVTCKELLRGLYGAGNYLRNRFSCYQVEWPFSVIWIQPEKIEWKIRRTSRTPQDRDLGAVLDGDWDLDVHDAFGLKYQGLCERYNDGIPWEETSLFRDRYAIEIQERRVRGCRTLSELVAQYELRYDNLYESIRRDGFRSSLFFGPTIQPIYVFIGRGGEILWFNGNHRLYLARILGIRRIPVRVWARHRQWQSLREGIFNRKTGWSPSEPRLMDHPDLERVGDKGWLVTACRFGRKTL